ncbi:hypothetical protein E1287_27745 [Actinomadura sp. KC06]|uniref:hypothetical protein n=1 Tax=Actinomadura sp. KC06 TaxID=2530369 RepID=UPI00104B3F39|nr:hypothetical protein [Actinomadura sp. KC06]TDD31097.1 hypothetical protein E1287_27745 [Actinomadura sp. KC06]
MAGPVTLSCHAIHVELTELLLLDRPLPAPLARHIAHCADCSAEAAGVRRVIRTFERAEPGHPGSGFPPVSRFATGPVSVEERGEPLGTGPRRTSGGRHRLAAAAAGLVLAACAVLTTVVPGDSPEAPPAGTVTLSRHEPMIEYSWGTEVPVSLSGLRPGATYRFLTGDAEGRRESAGSVHAGGEARMRTRMVTAMARSEIIMLLVQDEDGRMVARLPVKSPPRTPR